MITVRYKNSKYILEDVPITYLELVIAVRILTQVDEPKILYKGKVLKELTSPLPDGAIIMITGLTREVANKNRVESIGAGAWLDIRVINVETNSIRIVRCGRDDTTAILFERFMNIYGVSHEFVLGFYLTHGDDNPDGCFMHKNKCIADFYLGSPPTIFIIPIVRFTASRVFMENAGVPWPSLGPIGASQEVPDSEQERLNILRAKRLVYDFYQFQECNEHADTHTECQIVTDQKPAEIALPIKSPNDESTVATQSPKKVGFGGFAKGFLNKKSCTKTSTAISHVKSSVSSESFHNESAPENAMASSVTTCEHTNCNKKLGLLARELRCRCGHVFCRTHRHITSHACSSINKNLHTI